MRSHSYETGVESIKSQQAAQRYNPAKTIVFRPTGQTNKVTLPLNAGSRDHLSFFRSKGNTFTEDWYLVLSQNCNLGYCGLQVIFYNQREGCWETYKAMEQFVDSGNIEEFFGPSGLDLEAHNLVRALLQRAI